MPSPPLSIPRLERPPIREALVDIRVERPEGFSSSSLKVLPTDLPFDFTEVEEQRSFEGQFGMKEGKVLAPTTKDLGVRGYIYKARSELAQFRADGFTYNRLQPYEDWSAMEHKALALWERFLQLASPLAVGRVALRYINRISLEETKDLSFWLQAPPQKLDRIPGRLSSFLTRISTEDEHTGICSHLVTTLEGPLQSDIAGLIIDIDVFCVGRVKQDTEAIRSVLGQLRQTKNDIFFSTVRPGTLAEKADQ